MIARERVDRGRSRLAVGLVALLLWGCGPGPKAQPHEEDEAPPRPQPKDLRLALGSEHQSPAGGRQECLGRLVFDVAGAVQWGIKAPGTSPLNQWRFTRALHGGHDDAHIDNYTVTVMAPAKPEDVEQMVQEQERVTRGAIRIWKKDLEVTRRVKTNLEDLLAGRRENVNEEDLSTYPEGIKEYEQAIAEIESNIKAIEENDGPFDLGLPQSRGYLAGGTLYASLYREGRVYWIRSTGGGGAAPFPERQRDFHDFVRRFRPRQAYEIPTERGICIPFGFIPDEGQRQFNIALSMRYADRPGVLYTLATGIVDRHEKLGPEPVLTKATARAATGVLGGLMVEGAPRSQKTLGPRPVQIGALPAYQGGVALNVAEKGKPPVIGYSVYTGFGGWSQSQVLPFITVDMRSFTKAHDKSLTEDPPPFDESLARLDALLRSVRLRPTDKPMPELVDLGP